MKILARTIAVIFTVLFLTWVGLRIAYAISFNIYCEGHLKRAADANTINLAKQELTTALEYIKSHNLTQGSTHLFFPTPECDCGFWYKNIKSAKEELENISPEATQLEKTNILMKLRETLLDQNADGVSVTFPPGITVFPYQWFFLLWGWISFIVCIVFWFVVFTN